VPLSTFSDESLLLLQVANGDEKAFELLYKQHADAVYGVALTYSKSREIAEEIVQDVFVKVWTGRDKLPEIHHFPDYIFILARNQLLNVLKKKFREKAYRAQLAAYFKENNLTPEAQLIGKESSALVEKALLRLPQQQQIIYKLVRVEGMKLNDVSAELGLARNTVRNHLFRAVKSIQAKIHHGVHYLLILSAALLSGGKFL
jgi:RNA polymerase sigma-70 factor (ECF subfamily)